MRVTFAHCLIALAASCLIALVFLARGSSSRPEPILAGKLERGTFWKYPLSATSNEGRDYEKGSLVEVYKEFVVVTTKEGVSHVHEHYSGLALKKD